MEYSFYIAQRTKYRIMPYTSAAREGTTLRRSLFKSQEESLIISNLFEALVKYDSYWHNISDGFGHICRDRSQM